MTEEQAAQLIAMMSDLQAMANTLQIFQAEAVFLMWSCVGIVGGWMVASALIDQSNKGILNY